MKVDRRRVIWKTFPVITVEGPRGAEEWFNKDAPDFDHASVYLIHQDEVSSDDTKDNDNDSKKSTIFLRCPHDITDGIGNLHLLQQLLGYAGKALEQGNDFVMPTFGNEGVRLSPCLRVAAGIPETLSRIKRSGGRISRTETDGYMRTRMPVFWVYPLRAPSRIQMDLLGVDVHQVLRQCKTIGMGVSITHVFTAALALVLAQLQAKPTERDNDGDARAYQYLNHSMINLRPYVQQSYVNPNHAAAAYHTVSAHALTLDIHPATATATGSSEEDLIRLASEVRDFCKSILPPTSDSKDTPDQTTFAPLTYQSFTPPPGINPHTVSTPPFCPVSLSCIRNISNIVSRIHGVLELQIV
ncbi:hypothetical protein BDV19DRAFT_384568 [Aspergillus venezuelensis]